MRKEGEGGRRVLHWQRRTVRWKFGEWKLISSTVEKIKDSFSLWQVGHVEIKQHQDLAPDRECVMVVEAAAADAMLFAICLRRSFKSAFPLRRQEP